MKICLLTSQYRNIRTGAGYYTSKLIPELRERDHQVTVVCPEGECEPEDGLCITVRTAGIDFSHGKWFSLSRSFADYLAENSGHFDIIHFADAREAFFLKPSSTPAVGTVHDTYYLDSPPVRLMKKHFDDWPVRWCYSQVTGFLERTAYRKPDLLIANTRFVAASIARNLHRLRREPEVVHYGIHKRPIDVSRCINKSGPGSESTILFIGGNFRRKGLPVLFKALQIVSRDYPGLELDIIGTHRSADTMKKIARRYSSRYNVKFHGWIDNEELGGFYEKADIFVMPSIFEAFGIVYMEAMARGVPVIATENGGCDELITEGREGLLVPPGDHRMLAMRILELLEKPALRSELVRAAAEKLDSFTIDKMAEKTVNVYEKAMNLREYLTEG